MTKVAEIGIGFGVSRRGLKQWRVAVAQMRDSIKSIPSSSRFVAIMPPLVDDERLP